MDAAASIGKAADPAQFANQGLYRADVLPIGEDGTDHLHFIGVGGIDDPPVHFSFSDDAAIVDALPFPSVRASDGPCVIHPADTPDGSSQTIRCFYSGLFTFDARELNLQAKLSAKHI